MINANLDISYILDNVIQHVHLPHIDLDQIVTDVEFLIVIHVLKVDVIAADLDISYTITNASQIAQGELTHQDQNVSHAALVAIHVHRQAIAFNATAVIQCMIESVISIVLQELSNQVHHANIVVQIVKHVLLLLHAQDAILTINYSMEDATVPALLVLINLEPIAIPVIVIVTYARIQISAHNAR